MTDINSKIKDSEWLKQLLVSKKVITLDRESDNLVDLFLKNNFGYDDLKLFGKIEDAENLKSIYQASMFDKTITYSAFFGE